MDSNKMKHIDESEIRDYFQGHGTIKSIEIPRDHVTLRPKGYILIEFEKSVEANIRQVILLGGIMHNAGIAAIISSPMNPLGIDQRTVQRYFL